MNLDELEKICKQPYRECPYLEDQCLKLIAVHRVLLEYLKIIKEMNENHSCGYDCGLRAKTALSEVSKLMGEKGDV